MLKITLGFDENDFEQYEAYQILKDHNRKISKYVTKLVINDKNNLELKDIIRETIKEEIENRIKNLDLSSNSGSLKTNTDSGNLDNDASQFASSDEDIVNSLLSSFPGLG